MKNVQFLALDASENKIGFQYTYLCSEIRSKLLDAQRFSVALHRLVRFQSLEETSVFQNLNPTNIHHKHLWRKPKISLVLFRCKQPHITLYRY